MCDAVQKLVEEERAEAIAEAVAAERANVDSKIAKAIAKERARADSKIAKAVAKERARVDKEREKAARLMLEGNVPPKDVSRYLSMPLGKVNSIAASMGQ